MNKNPEKDPSEIAVSKIIYQISAPGEADIELPDFIKVDIQKLTEETNKGEEMVTEIESLKQQLDSALDSVEVLNESAVDLKDRFEFVKLFVKINLKETKGREVATDYSCGRLDAFEEVMRAINSVERDVETATRNEVLAAMRESDKKFKHTMDRLKDE